MNDKVLRFEGVLNKIWEEGENGTENNYVKVTVKEDGLYQTGLFEELMDIFENEEVKVTYVIVIFSRLFEGVLIDVMFVLEDEKNVVCLV